jgi:hypothetical protein
MNPEYFPPANQGQLEDSVFTPKPPKGGFEVFFI